MVVFCISFPFWILFGLMTSGGYGFGFPVVCVVDSLGLESDNKGGLGGVGGIV